MPAARSEIIEPDMWCHATVARVVLHLRRKVLLGYGRSFADTSIAVILLTLLYALRCCACAREDGGFAVEM